MYDPKADLLTAANHTRRALRAIERLSENNPSPLRLATQQTALITLQAAAQSIQKATDLLLNEPTPIRQSENQRT